MDLFINYSLDIFVYICVRMNRDHTQHTYTPSGELETRIPKLQVDMRSNLY